MHESRVCGTIRSNPLHSNSSWEPEADMGAQNRAGNRVGPECGTESHTAHEAWILEHSIMMVNSTQPCKVGGGVDFLPLSFYDIYHHKHSCGVHSSWEGRYSAPISPLPFLLCAPDDCFGWGISWLCGRKTRECIMHLLGLAADFSFSPFVNCVCPIRKRLRFVGGGG